MLARELDIIKSAAKNAGTLAHDLQKRGVQSWEKGNDQGPVSEADLAVNEYLNAEFQKHLPECAILSEEDEDDLSRLDAKRLLVIDPIDGTKAFLNGEDYFAISIALLEDNQPVIGVIVAPALGDVYTASQGMGAFCNGEKLQISQTQDLQHATALASQARYNREKLAKFPDLKTHFRPSIALRLALVARGDFDMTIALRPSWDWDIAGGDCILREAGGVISDQNGNALTYNSKIPQQNGIVAGSPHLVQEFITKTNEE